MNESSVTVASLREMMESLPDNAQVFFHFNPKGKPTREIMQIQDSETAEVHTICILHYGEDEQAIEEEDFDA